MKIIEKVRQLKKGSDKVWEQPLARDFPNPMAVEIETGQFLYGLVRAIKPINAIETGTFEGFSAISIAQALKDNKKGLLWTIDYKDYGAKKMFKNYGVEEWIAQIIGVSPAILEKIVSENDIDFAFLDCRHTYKAVFSELEVLHKYFKIGSYIAGHDCRRYYEINMAVNAFTNKYPRIYEKIEISTFAGIFVLKKVSM